MLTKSNSAREARRTRRPRLLNMFLLLPLVLLTSVAASAQAPLVYDVPERHVIKSQVLGEERVVLVRTPAGYARGSERFPVLYLTDGDAHIFSTRARRSPSSRRTRGCRR